MWDLSIDIESHCLGEIAMRMSVVRQANCSKDWILGIPVYWFQVMRRKQQRGLGRSSHLAWKTLDYHVQKSKLNKSFERNGCFRGANAADKSSTVKSWILVAGLHIVVEEKPDFSSSRENGRREIADKSINSSLCERRGMKW